MVIHRRREDINKHNKKEKIKSGAMCKNMRGGEKKKTKKQRNLNIEEHYKLENIHYHDY